jgi:uncharacterized protein YgbK (DUF1537 family)
MENSIAPELGIVADDLTGATDTGLQFAKCGRRTSVCLSWPAGPPCDVLVFDADSRHRPPGEARERVASASRALRSAGAQRFYKKVDSTGRGNLGAEIESMLAVCGATQALVCPAFPQLGRTVRDGQILVRGVPLDQTEFRQDPRWPATTASLAEILRRQTVMPIELITLGDVRRGPSHVRARLLERRGRRPRLVVADAESSLDARCLVEVVRQAEGEILAVGSAGLAEWLAGSLVRPARRPKVLTLPPGPILVVSGTLNRVGISQLARLLELGAALVPLAAADALDDPSAAIAVAGGAVARALGAQRCTILTLGDPRAPAPGLNETVETRGLSLALATERLTSVLGRATGRALSDAVPAALILTGGDTARAVCSELGTTALEVDREVAPGIPLCRLQGGRWDGLPIVTKAGGFGDGQTLGRVLGELEGLQRELD